MAIGIINAVPSIQRVLIIAPANLKINWYRESKKWLTKKLSIGIASPDVFPTTDIVIINFDICYKYEKKLSFYWDLVIIDEAHRCFPSDVKVMTDCGEVSIGEIVTKRLNLKALSVNMTTGKTEYKQIIGYTKTTRNNRIIKIKHEHGELRCTEDHRIWTDSGYQEARQILCNQNLYSVRQEVQDLQKRQGHGLSVQSQLHQQAQLEQVGISTKNQSVDEDYDHQEMRMVQKGISVSLQGRNGQSESTILRMQLCSILENDSAGKKEKITRVNRSCAPCIDREEISKFIFQDEVKQSDVRSKSQSQNDRIKQGENISCSWWQRQTNEAADCFIDGIAMADRIPNSNNSGKGQISIASELIQSRSGKREPKDSCGSGWEHSQDSKMEIPRPEENRNTECSRVVSVEILESGSGYRSDWSSEKDSTVYCIEVEGNHNFFANGVLVENCKNPDARRSRAILGYFPTKKEAIVSLKKRYPDTDEFDDDQIDVELAKIRKSPIPTKRKLLLTGTPIPNKVSELFPLLRFLDPKEWDSYFKFAIRYSGAKQSGYGWVFDWPETMSATEKQLRDERLAELQNKLRATCMIRRLKSQVLTELPAKRRAIIEVPINSEEARQAVSSERSAYEVDDLAEYSANIELAKASDNPADYEKAVAALRERIGKESGSLFEARHKVALAKVPYAIEHINELMEDGRKLIVFGHHLDALKALHAAFPGSALVIGEGMNASQRQTQIDRFQNDPKCPIIFGGIYVMGVGYNLTAAATVLMFELDWVPGNVTQCEDRAHRIGQKDSVLVQHLVLEGSVDVDVANAIIRKQEIADKTLDVKPGETSQTIQPVITKVDVEISQPVVPVKGISVRMVEIEEKAKQLTLENLKAIHTGLQILAGMDDDHARDLNGIGFSKIDVAIGHSLASQSRITARQGVLGLKLCQKYFRQLGPDLLAQAGVKLKEGK
jgi:hypothetical protein